MTFSNVLYALPVAMENTHPSLKYASETIHRMRAGADCLGRRGDRSPFSRELTVWGEMLPSGVTSA